MLYFDHALTSPTRKEVIEKMAPFFQIHWATPISPYVFGQPLHPQMREAYEAIYALLGASHDDCFILTSSGAEAVNHVVMGTYIDITRKMGKNHFLCSNMGEAPAILSMTRMQELGCLFDMVPVNEKGEVSEEALIGAITPRTALVSVSLGCGVSGALQNSEKLHAICQERGIYLHVDVTHVLGKGSFDISADFITFNGEQIGGPKGTGGLLMRKQTELSPLILGGNEQAGLRGGSFNVPGLIGLGVAAKCAHENRDHVAMETARLRNLFEERVKALLPDVRIVLEEQVRLPHVTTLIFEEMTTDALAYLLSRQNLYANRGGGQFQQIRFLLAALSIESHGGLSFAFCEETTQEQILKAAKVLAECVTKLKRYKIC